jgi:hypothetical protein
MPWAEITIDYQSPVLLIKLLLTFFYNFYPRNEFNLIKLVIWYTEKIGFS